MPGFEQYLRAGFPVIWASTVEPHRAERELAAAYYEQAEETGQEVGEV